MRRYEKVYESIERVAILLLEKFGIKDILLIILCLGLVAALIQNK